MTARLHRVGVATLAVGTIAGAGFGQSASGEIETTSLLGSPLRRNTFDPETARTLDTNLRSALDVFALAPDDADTIIWLGRRLAYAMRYRDAIAVYTRGLRLHPDDPRLYRHRGHRYVSTRRFDEAIADFERAAALLEGRPVAIEPDGIPSRRGVPTSTTHFNVYYHLGLAHYLKGDFEAAVAAYRRCLDYSRDSDENLVATSDWLYMALRRAGRDAEAAAVLEAIHDGLDVIDNLAYRDRLSLYKGERRPEDLTGGDDPLEDATRLYGLANWHYCEGRVDAARVLWRRILDGAQWSAFGYIAAEADWSREHR